MAIGDERPDVDDRRKTSNAQPGAVEERRADRPRRAAPRIKTFKGAKIVSPGALSLNCIVRNMSKTGAQLELQSSVGDEFELVFGDSLTPPQMCRVVWRDYPRIGVKFDVPADASGPIARALSKLRPKKQA